MQLYTGVVENRQDPLKLGRCQVRVHGLHTHDKIMLKTEDLPWAHPMQSVNSAAMSGIGQSPVGPVEGTAVVIMFRDDDEQMPIILGTIGGIPQAQGAVDKDMDGMILKQDGEMPSENAEVVTDSTGQTSTTADPNSNTTETSNLKPARDYSSISNSGINLIKQFEGLRLTSYQDSVGIWTIGYGTTRINGSPVTPGMTITQAQADQYLMDHINTNVAPTIKSKVKALVTQSMFDAMCCFTYNVGNGAFSKSTLLSELNLSKYIDAAGHFLDWNKAGGQVLAGLTKRRTAEKDLFLKEGAPNATGDITPVAADQTPVDTVASGSSAPSNGMGSDSGIAMILGFKDPKGKYPLYLNEPDTNRLARNEDIQKTIVYRKEQAREKGVITAQGKTWNQSPVPYNTMYPFNHVFQSESGHVLEFDDTEHSERIHIYHKSGTYTETDANGTQVNRIVGDKYEILERNGFVYIKGSANVTIDGEHNIKIVNALNVDVSGKATINVYNNADVNVSGSMNLAVKEALNIKAASINMESYTGGINIKSAADLNTQSAGDINIKAGGSLAGEGSRIDMNTPGAAGNATGSGLSTPTNPDVPEMPEFSELVVITRGAAAASNYETPEDGDPTAYVQKRLDNGTLPSDEKDSGAETDSASTSDNGVQPAGAKCDTIYAMEKFSPSLQLTPHFNLGRLTSNGTRLPVDQQGLKAQEIVCNLKGLAENCLEQIINLYPGIMITSGFRRPGDVAASSGKSQHYLGQAADIVIPGYTRKQHYEAIQTIQQLIPYDQLLLEYSGSSTVWIHVSFKYEGNRKQNFTMRDHKRVSEFGTFKLIE